MTRWAADYPAEPAEFRRRLFIALENRSELEVHALISATLYFERDSEGFTSAQRAEAADFPGLKNDERVLLRSKMQTRVALLEVQRILDGEHTEVLDLLAESPVPFVIQDRAFAKAANRFTAYLSWIYPLPHSTRLSGTGVAFPQLGLADVKVLAALARHLGAPAADFQSAEGQTWLATHMKELTAALFYARTARADRALRTSPIRNAQALYELTAPEPECVEALVQAGDLFLDVVEPREAEDGAREARVWLMKAEEAPRKFPEGFRGVLGRIVFIGARWRLQAVTEERLRTMQARLEAALGARVQLKSESIEDLAGSLPDFDTKPVPPELLENVPPLTHLTVYQPSGGIAQYRGATAQLNLETLRAFPDTPLDELHGKSPTEALTDTALNEVLVRLIKVHFRALDEHNREFEFVESPPWLQGKLGLPVTRSLGELGRGTLHRPLALA